VSPGVAASLSRGLPGTPSLSKLALDTFSLHNATLYYYAHETTQLRFLQWSLYGRDDALSRLRGLLTRSAVSELYKRRGILEQKLEALEDPEVVSPTNQSTITSDLAYATSYLDTKDLHQLSRRRKSIPENKIQEVDHDISSIASAIASDTPLNQAQIRSLRKLISLEVGSISDELRGNTSLSRNHYPHNLSIRDFYSYIPLPTVVYELEYPRETRINWSYVAEKTAATFGVIGVMIVVSTAFIYPVVASAVQMKADGMPLRDRVREMPWLFSDLLFPFFMEYILSWYVIWECVVSIFLLLFFFSPSHSPVLIGIIFLLCSGFVLNSSFLHSQLNVLAELTLFADRGFYADWWNSTSWDQFARDWNRPVHNFLLRHVYHASISTWDLSRSSATLLTFLLSACVHELVMAVIFQKVRGYLLMMQMAQLPLVMLSRTRFLKGRDILGNMIFWLGIFVGPSLLCTLYLLL
jgi:sterol O-acyltransferase